MGLLVGLPLKLFHIAFVLLRFLWPLLVLLLVRWLVRRLRRRRDPSGSAPPRRETRREPDFHGPVYTVDYEDVEEHRDEDRGGTP